MSDPLEALIEQIQEGDEAARLAAIRDMGDLADPRAAPMLMTVVLFDERAYVRYDATRALTRVNPQEGASYLERVVRSEGHGMKIRCRAIKALGWLGGPELVPLLEELAADGDGPEGDMARQALQRILKRI